MPQSDKPNDFQREMANVWSYCPCPECTRSRTELRQIRAENNRMLAELRAYQKEDDIWTGICFLVGAAIGIPVGRWYISPRY